MTVRNDAIASRVAMVAVGAGVALFGLLSSMSMAGATEGPDSGDDRATAIAGNVTTCEAAGLVGSDITGQLTASTTGEEQNQFLSVTGVPGGVTVTGIVLKGGDNYNLYVPGELGLPTTPPWTDLHAPLVGADNQNVPTISHWFACGVEESSSSPPSTSVPSTSVPSTSVPGTSVPGSVPPATPPATSPMPAAATSSGALAPIGAPSSAAPVASPVLAETGVATWPTIGLGAGLIAGGCGIAFLARRRRGSSAAADS